MILGGPQSQSGLFVKATVVSVTVSGAMLYVAYTCTSSLLNDALSDIDYIVLNDWAILNDEFKGRGRKGSRLNLMHPSCIHPKRLRKTIKSLNQGIQCVSRVSNLAPTEHKSEA
jgi:hypothetical protein